MLQRALPGIRMAQSGSSRWCTNSGRYWRRSGHRPVCTSRSFPPHHSAAYSDTVHDGWYQGL